MDISVGEDTPKRIRAETELMGSQQFLSGIVQRMIGFFILSEEEISLAGINLVNYHLRNEEEISD